jgi:hypothetical protein
MIYYHKDSKFLLKPHKKSFFKIPLAPIFASECIRYGDRAKILNRPILSSECGSRRASQKKPLWDSSKTYSPKGFTFRDVRLMPRYHGQM